MKLRMFVRAAWNARRSGTAALSAYLVMLSPLVIPACQTGDLGDLLGNLNLNGVIGGGPLTKNSVGFFVNEDLDSDLLVAGRGPTRDEFYIFGERASDGQPTGVTSILVKQANGDESFMNFDEGWPVYVEGPDGSYARIEYVERSQALIVANVTIHDAASGQEDTVLVDFDGFQTAQQVAAEIEQATGIRVQIPQTPPFADPRGKPQQTEQGALLTSVFLFAFAAIAVNVVNFNTAILGQVLLETLNGVATVLQVVVLAIFSPFFLIGQILSGSLNRVELTPIIDVVVRVPSEPRPRD